MGEDGASGAPALASSAVQVPRATASRGALTTCVSPKAGQQDGLLAPGGFSGEGWRSFYRSQARLS